MKINMKINLTVLTRQQLVSHILQLNRENKCLNTELLRFQLICKYYDKLCDVLETNNDFVKQEFNKNELKEQIKTLKSLKSCEIMLNLLENNNDFIENNIITNYSQNETNSKIYKNKEFCFDGVNDDNLNINNINTDLGEKHNELNESINADIIDNSNNDSVISGNFCEIIETRVKKEKFICEWNKCGKVLSTNYRLKLHMLRIHNQTPEDGCFKCDFDGCDYTCLKSTRLLVHKSKHSKEKHYKCNICNTGYRNRRELNDHNMKKHNNGIQTYACDFPNCDRSSFKTQYSLMQHKRDKHKVYTFKCNRQLCKTRAKLNDHINKIHKNKIKKQVLKRHLPCMERNQLKVRIKKGIKSYACEWPGCDMSFKYEQFLSRHMRYHWVGIDYTFRCSWPECSYIADNKNTLDEHIEIHKGIKKHECDWPQCEFIATDKSILDTHKKSNS